jgi:hypothetical protein
MLARRFLWIVTIVILLVLGGALTYRLFAPQLMRAAFVPSVKFSDEGKGGPDYRRADTWLARPGLDPDPALWTPAGFAPTPRPRASIFFVHPTSYLDRAHWNAPLADRESQDRARLFVRSQASAFNGVGAIWAPKYRQATIGAFLTGKRDADQALDLAERDVRAAFDQFLAEAPKDRPIILAAHSQGSFLLSRLLAERVARTPLARRIAAAYLVGWPLSTSLDLPRLGLPACRSAAQAGCILAWQSFAEPADDRQVIDIYNGSAGPDGQHREGTPILCVNPITGNQDDAAPAAANRGTLVPDATLTRAELRAGAVPARCDPRGLLLIGEDPVEMPPYILPGNNYHVFDYALFWADIRADAERRLNSYLAR